jgi:hypothetical protein
MAARAESDERLFDEATWPALRRAVEELSWLLERGYAATSAVKLVGDRHGLNARQRKGVVRCSCPDEALAGRRRRRVPLAAVRGRVVALDGFNCLITLETALDGRLVLLGRDGCARDLASIHGAYRRGRRTMEAIDIVGEMLARLGACSVIWLLDRPVSHSGELQAALQQRAAERGWPWQAIVEDNPDVVLARPERAGGWVVATSDSWVLDRCETWCDLVGEILRSDLRQGWVVDLGKG